MTGWKTDEIIQIENVLLKNLCMTRKDIIENIERRSIEITGITSQIKGDQPKMSIIPDPTDPHNPLQ